MTLYVDIITTGHTSEDEIINIAIINDDCEVLLNSLVKPMHHTSWSESEDCYFISPERVTHSPTYDELRPTIRRLFQDQELVMYDRESDGQYLKTELMSAKKILCCTQTHVEQSGGHLHKNFAKPLRFIRMHSDLAADGALADVQGTRILWHALSRPNKQLDDMINAWI